MRVTGARQRGSMSGPYVIRGSVSLPEAELIWRFSRSSGPGGQHVNTSDSQVELRFDLAATDALPPMWKERALQRLAGRLVNGVVSVRASEHCSQWRNRETAAVRLASLLADATPPPHPHPARHQRAPAAREEAARRHQAGPVRPRLALGGFVRPRGRRRTAPSAVPAAPARNSSPARSRRRTAVPECGDHPFPGEIAAPPGSGIAGYCQAGSQSACSPPRGDIGAPLRARPLLVCEQPYAPPAVPGRAVTAAVKAVVPGISRTPVPGGGRVLCYTPSSYGM